MKSYKDLALYDMKSLIICHEHEMWNKVGRESQQVCEKYIKHYLQKNHLLSDDLARTHNLRKLIRSIPSHTPELYKQMSTLSGYYYETNYPGEDYMELDEQLANEAFEITKALMKYIDGLD